MSAGRAANPIALHRLDILWEFDVVELVEQLVGIVGHLEEPLCHVLLNDLQTAPPTAVVLHLLIGQYSVAILTPIHRSSASLDQPRLIETDENLLIPAIIFGRRCRQCAPPVVGISHPLLIGPNHRDITLCNRVRVPAFLLRRVLGGHPEGIVSHRIEYVHSHQALETSHRIADRVVSNVAHVHIAGGVGKHLEAVELRPRGVEIGVENTSITPTCLPSRLDFCGIVCHSLISHSNFIGSIQAPGRSSRSGASPPSRGCEAGIGATSRRRAVSI